MGKGLKSAAKIKGNNAGASAAKSAEVVNGRLRITLLPSDGIGGSGATSIKGGIAAHNEALVVAGALRVTLN
jgi:hypothetical protein